MKTITILYDRNSILDHLFLNLSLETFKILAILAMKVELTKTKGKKSFNDFSISSIKRSLYLESLHRPRFLNNSRTKKNVKMVS